MRNNGNVNRKVSKMGQSSEEKVEVKTWDAKLEKSPPKKNQEKRIIKNLKKK